MKKILCLLVVVVLSVSACSNKNTKTAGADGTITAADGYNASGKNAKYQIIDQEFDNLLAPDTDYDTVCAYELQACGDTYLPPAEQLNDMAKVKAAAKKADISKEVKNTRAKKVVNVTNVYEVDGPNPNVPTRSSKTTTVTTYENGQAVTKTTSSSGASSSSAY